MDANRGNVQTLRLDPHTRREAAKQLPRRMRDVLSLEDLPRVAKPFMPNFLYEFVTGGVERNLSRDGNRAAFDEIWFKTRVLRDVRERSLQRTLLGKTYDAPFGIAPMGGSALSAYRGDLVFARAAREANVPFVMSGSSLIRMEEVYEANPDIGFQAYVADNKEDIGALAKRAWDTGIRHFAVTVDVPVPGNRENNIRAGYSYPVRPTLKFAVDAAVHPSWTFGTLIRTFLAHGMPHLENAGAKRGIPMISAKAPARAHTRAGLSWDHLKWVRDTWKGNLLIKGVLSPEDAVMAKEIGLDGVYVSNHGGRQLDGALPPLKALPAIRAAVGPDFTLVFDGGIRRGTDIIKALGLGADFIFIGRPFNYAASLSGQRGAAHVIDILCQELDRNLALMGKTDLNDLAECLVLQD